LDGYLDALLGIYGEDFLGLCYDSGHAMIRPSANNCSLLNKHPGRIISVHLHDNLGYPEDEYDDEVKLGKADMHLIPYEGIINWDMVMEHLAKTTYQLPLVLEINMPAGISEEKFLKKAYDAAADLSAKFNKARINE
jgi:sugar phosphate isomerase/epimerase